MGSANDIGWALVELSLVFAGAALIRRWCRPLRALFLPTAVIGGFLILVLGPEVVGQVNDSN
jgi:ESS family glutamate:Na+ symporter